MKYEKWINKNIQSLDGQKIVITGGNSGIGFASAQYLCFLNAHVILACRSEKRAMAAIEKIKKENPKAVVDYINFDQSSFSSIDKFIYEIKDKYGKVDGFVANAGIYHPKENQKTEQGFSLTMGTNYIGLYYLSNHFKEFIKEKGNIVFVTSLTYKRAKIRNKDHILDDKCKPISEYANSKFAVAALFKSILLNGYFNCYLMHPGVSNTNIVMSTQSGFSRIFQSLAKIFMPLFTHSPSKACLGIILAFSKKSNNGSYIVPRGIFEIVGFPKIKKERCLNINRVNEIMVDSSNIVKEVFKNARD